MALGSGKLFCVNAEWKQCFVLFSSHLFIVSFRSHENCVVLCLLCCYRKAQTNNADKSHPAFLIENEMLLVHV